MPTQEAVDLVKTARNPALVGQALTNRYFNEFIASEWIDDAELR